MFIAMNRFRVKKGSEDAFEKVWQSVAGTGFVSRFCSGLLGVSSAQGTGGGRPYPLFLAYRLAEQAGLRGVDQIGRIPGVARACR